MINYMSNEPTKIVILPSKIPCNFSSLKIYLFSYRKLKKNTFSKDRNKSREPLKIIILPAKKCLELLLIFVHVV